jgi:hypothetical protein
MATAGSFGEKGRASDGAKCPHGRIHTSGNQFLGSIEELLGGFHVEGNVTVRRKFK